MIKELDRVALNSDLPGTHLHNGDEGVIVMVLKEGEAYEVEFFAADGRTVAVETVGAAFLYPVDHTELAM